MEDGTYTRTRKVEMMKELNGFYENLKHGNDSKKVLKEEEESKKRVNLYYNIRKFLREEMEEVATIDLVYLYTDFIEEYRRVTNKNKHYGKSMLYDTIESENDEFWLLFLRFGEIRKIEVDYLGGASEKYPVILDVEKIFRYIEKDDDFFEYWSEKMMKSFDYTKTQALIKFNQIITEFKAYNIPERRVRAMIKPGIDLDKQQPHDAEEEKEDRKRKKELEKNNEIDVVLNQINNEEMLKKKTVMNDKSLRTIDFYKERPMHVKSVGIGVQGIQEIIAFNVDRILQINRKPPASGRLIPSSILFPVRELRRPIASNKARHKVIRSMEEEDLEKFLRKEFELRIDNNLPPRDIDPYYHDLQDSKLILDNYDYKYSELLRPFTNVEYSLIDLLNKDFEELKLSHEDLLSEKKYFEATYHINVTAPIENQNKDYLNIIRKINDTETLLQTIIKILSIYEFDVMIPVSIHAWISEIHRKAPKIEHGRYLVQKSNLYEQGNLKVTLNDLTYLLDVSDTIVFDFILDDHDRDLSHNWQAHGDKLLIWDSGLAFRHGPIGKIGYGPNKDHCIELLCGLKEWVNEFDSKICKKTCLFRKKTIDKIRSVGPDAEPDQQLGYLLDQSLKNDPLYPHFDLIIFYYTKEKESLVHIKHQNFIRGINQRVGYFLDHVDWCIEKYGENRVIIDF
eukprot:TRINITY_DN4225_c0_g1_i2.p1 TRINITY_DN4225_c0_g1~~TRINITY_DN4225_c0_g1_i2.p1  ORF type:complete len:680 (-),score=181.25 TRINITY_DN4225_c0_g1_i2:312-2351(-)